MKSQANRKKRTDVYIVFIDLEKAFDSVNRPKLLKTIIKRGYNNTIIRAYRQFMEGMTLETASGKAETNIGAVQGEVTSQLSINIAIDSLITIDEISLTFALADDIAAIIPGRVDSQNSK